MGHKDKLEYRYPGIRSTLNQMGFVFDYATEYGQSFLEACKRHAGTVLEIGSGYGGLASEALETGAMVYVNDLDAEHLEILADQIEERGRSRLCLSPGKFPDAIEFSEGTFDSIYSSNMFHFLNCEEFIQGINKVFTWLKPGGQVFLITGTPFVPMLDQFFPTYYKRKEEKKMFPGFIEDMSILDHDWVPNLPKSMLLMEKDELENYFVEAGFEVEKTSYINRYDFPEHMRMDGRENVGIIACKRQ